MPPDGLAGVDPTLASLIRQLQALIREVAPEIELVVTSGRRTPAQQQSLLDRFRGGDRVGIAGEPAVNSRHLVGRAVDLGWRVAGTPVPASQVPLSAWRFVADLLAPFGVRWGGRFRAQDVVHFDIS